LQSETNGSSLVMRALACTLVDGEPAPACSVRVHPPTRPGRSSDYSRNPHLWPSGVVDFTDARQGEGDLWFSIIDVLI
jgi:hypothetical protein